MEYFSAALCYILVTASIAYLPALLIDRAVSTLRDRLASALKKAPLSVPHVTQEPLHPIVDVWYVVILLLLMLFLPTTHESLKWSTVVWASFFGIMIAGLLIYAVLAGIVEHRALIAQSPDAIKWHAKLRRLDIGGAISILVGIFTIVAASAVDKFFLCLTVFLYVVICYQAGTHVWTLWQQAKTRLKVIYALFVTLALIGHMQAFGQYQFGRIPNALGGGKPQLAYLQIDPRHLELIPLLQIMSTNAPTGSTNCVGPVLILLKGEREIIFLAPPERNATNKVARQIRSDLVDAIRFIK